MMIAGRFKAVGMVAGVASAGIGLYLISLQVAAERGRLERVERQIAATRGDIRMLQTEFGARASMRQLEKWNGEVFALSTPKAVQFLHGQVQLASFDPGMLDPTLARPKVQMASGAKPAIEKPQPATPAVDTATVRYATYTKSDEPAAVVRTGSGSSPSPAPALLRRAALATEAPVAPKAAPAKADTGTSAAPKVATKPKPVKLKPVESKPARSVGAKEKDGVRAGKAKATAASPEAARARTKPVLAAKKAEPKR